MAVLGLHEQEQLCCFGDLRRGATVPQADLAAGYGLVLAGLAAAVVRSAGLAGHGSPGRPRGDQPQVDTVV